jgi:5-methyltetrahydropteroyltriglutamate--homocysteine methyltransferase
VELGDIIDLALRFRGREINYEAANPRHEHEWRVFEDIQCRTTRSSCPA